MQKIYKGSSSYIRKRVPHIVPTQRSRTTVERTKPQCQPIDLRCSLRGPLLRREKNKLIERGGGESGRRERRWKREEVVGRRDGRKRRRSGEREKERTENVGSKKEHFSRKRRRQRNERKKNERAKEPHDGKCKVE